jgi:hypothetical protein
VNVRRRLPLLGIESAGESTHGIVALPTIRPTTRRAIAASFSERVKTEFMPCSWHAKAVMQAAAFTGWIMPYDADFRASAGCELGACVR